jgi:hypothetical protein
MDPEPHNAFSGGTSAFRRKPGKRVTGLDRRFALASGPFPCRKFRQFG